MKKNCLSILLKRGWICGSIICLAACGPVHRFTRVKNVPREYVRNYSVEGVKAPHSLSLFKHDPWIVFALQAVLLLFPAKMRSKRSRTYG